MTGEIGRGGEKGEGGREGKGGDIPLMAHGLEFGFVLGIRLDAEGGGEDELADRGAEAGEECVEGLVEGKGGGMC